MIKLSVISAASTGTSHINDRLVLRAAGFYCSGASQGLRYRGKAQLLSPHMIHLQPDTLLVYLDRCLVLNSQPAINDWQRNRRERAREDELGFTSEALAGHGGMLRLCLTESSLAGVGLLGLRAKSNYLSMTSMPALSKYFYTKLLQGFIHELVTAVQNILEGSSAPAICWKQGLNFCSLITEPSGKERHYTQITLLSLMPRGQRHTCRRKIHHAPIWRRQKGRANKMKHAC